MILPLFVCFPLLFNKVMASCTDEQQETCMGRYHRSTSFWFPTNELEECTQKSYAHFSHMCTVDNYLPDVDHCCCHVPRIPATNKNYQQGSSDKVVLCCRYNQDWNKFRCEVEKDVVDPSTFHGGSYASIFDTYPYNILFYMFFVILTIILIVIVIHLFRRFNRSRIQVYKQTSQENRLISNVTTNVQATNTTIINPFPLPLYTEKADNDGGVGSRRTEDTQPSAPLGDLALDTEALFTGTTNQSNEVFQPPCSNNDEPPRIETPPPPYERISA